MKKTLPLILVLCVLLAAAAGWFYVSRPKEDPAPPVVTEPEKFLPNFGSVESEKMGSYMLNGYNLIMENGTIFSFSNLLRVGHLTFKVEEGEITRTDAESEPNRKTFEIEELGNTSFLCEGPDDAVYGLSKEGRIIRLPKGSPDFKTIAGPGIKTLQIADGKFWYSKGDNYRFFRADMDGKNETRILDKEIYFPYVVGNFLVYQDDADGESLRLYNMNEKNDIKLLEGRVLSPNIVGNWIFCSQENTETHNKQLVGIEFKASGEFEVHVFNNGEDWFSDMKQFRYVAARGFEPVAEKIIHAGTLAFNGNFANSEIGGPMGARAADLMHSAGWEIGGVANVMYSSPYGYVEFSLDGNFGWYLNENPVVMPDGLYETEWGEKILKELKK